MTGPTLNGPTVSGPAVTGPAPGVIVAVPAHDEQDLLPACLGHVLTALDRAQSTGSIGPAVIAVAAHRCTDRTAEVARRALGLDGSGGPHGRPAAGAVVAAGVEAGVAAVVLEDEASATIAEVRRVAVQAGARRLGREGGHGAGRGAQGTWIFNTDADSQVPPEWITAGLEVAAQERAVAVAGLVEVAGWDPPPPVRQAYDALVARGIRGSDHEHAYGANLAVRLDAYRAVGGFTPRRHGEDHDLLRRLRAAGLTVATPLAPRVSTSGRQDARSPDGLGALLRRLAETPAPAFP